MTLVEREGVMPVLDQIAPLAALIPDGTWSVRPGKRV